YDAIAARGLSVRDITDAVRIAFDGATVDEVRTPLETVRFRLQYASEDQGKLRTLRGLTLLNRQGQRVRLDGLVTLHERPGQAALRRYYGRRAITVTADIDRGAITVEAINRELREHLESSTLLAEYPNVRLHYGGEFEQQQAALGGVALAFLACLTGIFLVLLLLFGSATQPFLILIVLPFGLAGAIPGLALSGMDLSMMALVGLLGLAGVLVNDSVVMVSSLNERKGESPMLSHAELCAGAEGRLRPILLTSLTTVAGLFPTAYGIAGSNQFVAPMVVAMAWGVLFGTFVSLMLLPALYAVEQDIRRLTARFMGLFRRSPQP
ncbi:MAG: efflux RND transporter permease subunit, partial [Nannocystaceae bacterium]